MEKLYADDKRFSNKTLEWIRFNAQQEKFIYSTAKFTLGSGGKGGGKSVALCIRAILLSVISPQFGDLSGNTGLMGRLKHSDFMKTTYEELRLWLPSSWIRKYYKKDSIIELRNESTLKFTHLDSIEPLVSLNVGHCGIDQMEQIPEDVFKEVGYNRTRMKVLERYRYETGEKIRITPQFDDDGVCISTDPLELDAVLRYQPTYGVCNPRRVRWIMEKFIKNEDNRVSTRPRERKKHNPGYKLIYIPTTENLANLPDGYTELQKADKSAREYARDVMGEWGAFEGQVFIDFTDDLILNKRLIPRPEWDIYVGIDHGGTGIDKTGATGITHVTFLANEQIQGTYDKVHFIDELYLSGSTIEKTVAEIANKLHWIWHKQKYTYEVHGDKVRADVKAWRIGHDAARIIQDADETIMARYMRLARNLPDPMHMALLLGGKDQAARIEKESWMFRKKLFDINPHCTHAIDTFRTIEYGTNEKIKANQDDHASESLGAACSALPLFYQDFAKEQKKESRVDRVLRQQKNALTNMDSHPVFGSRYNAYTS